MPTSLSHQCSGSTALLSFRSVSSTSAQVSPTLFLLKDPLKPLHVASKKKRGVLYGDSSSSAHPSSSTGKSVAGGRACQVYRQRGQSRQQNPRKIAIFGDTERTTFPCLRAQREPR